MSSALSFQQLALVAESHKSQLLDDPLLHARWSSPQIREMALGLSQGLEVHVRAGLRSGKTTGAAHYFTALLRGVRELDSRTIDEERAGAPRDVIYVPLAPTPAVLLLGVSSLKQSSESAVACYRKMIGNRDARFLKGSQGTIADIRVRPDRMKSDDPDRWSRIMVFPIEGTPPTGIGAAACHADETPSEVLWRQMRLRVTAGYDLILCITQTPEDPNMTDWLREDYKRPEAWKIEILLSVFDNQALSPREKAKIRERAANDPLEMAHLYGAYVNLKGTNPWKKQAKLLQRWLEMCKNPIREETLMMPVEIETDTGLKIEDGFGEVFIFEDPIPGERYYGIFDGSMGLDGGDPCGGHITRRGFRSEKPGLVARYNGMCGGYALGHLAAMLCERYNDALADPDATGGYGQPVLRGLADYRSKRHPNGYPNINRDRAFDKQGRPYSKRLGTQVTPAVKADMVESIRWALLSDGFEFPSAATVRCFMEATADANQRLIKPAGVHYEDFHCGARSCQLTLDRNQTEPGNRREHEVRDAFQREGIKLPPFRKREGRLTQYQWTRS